MPPAPVAPATPLRRPRAAASARRHARRGRSTADAGKDGRPYEIRAGWVCSPRLHFEYDPRRTSVEDTAPVLRQERGCAQGFRFAWVTIEGHAESAGRGYNTRPRASAAPSAYDYLVSWGWPPTGQDWVSYARRKSPLCQQARRIAWARNAGFISRSRQGAAVTDDQRPKWHPGRTFGGRLAVARAHRGAGGPRRPSPLVDSGVRLSSISEAS